MRERDRQTEWLRNRVIQKERHRGQQCSKRVIKYSKDKIENEILRDRENEKEGQTKGHTNTETESNTHIGTEKVESKRKGQTDRET